MSSIYKDQLGNELSISSPPRRIVSLVPSLTEFLFDLGLVNEIVGVTNFCTHPVELIKKAVKVGGTKNFDVEKIQELNPDFILASKEENSKEGIEWLATNSPVWVSDIENLDDSYMMMEEVGKIMNKGKESEVIIKAIRKEFADLRPLMDIQRVVYFIWRKPYMTVGGDTFIHHMLQTMGLQNLFEKNQRYPIVEPEQLKALDPELIFLSSEPYPFSEKHIKEFQTLCPEAKIMLVEGEYFSWYGSRLRKSADYFKLLMEKL